MGRGLVPLVVLITLVTWLPSTISGQGENPAAGPGSSTIKNLPPDEAQKRITRSVSPKYPEPAKQAHIAGTVEIGLVISPGGDFSNTSRVLAGPPLLVEAAVEAIRQWVFQPVVERGQPTSGRIRALVRFNADGTTEVAFAPALLPDSFGDPGSQRNPALEAKILPIMREAGGGSEIRLSDAEQSYRTGKFDTAVQHYNSLIARGSQPALAYAGLTRVYLRQKKPAEAYAAAAKAIELDSALPDARIALGEAYFRQGKIVEAENEFVTLVRAGTSRSRAYLGEARVSQANSFYRQAKRMIDNAHDLDPADPDIQGFWVSTLSLSERIKALQDYLAHETNDDAKIHADLEHQLVVLQDEAALTTRPCQLATKISATQTNLKPLLIDPNHMRGYGLNVQLNGTAAALMVDTGAGGVVVDRKVAERAGIKHVVESSVRGIGDQGEPAAYVGYADSIKIGDLEFKDCYVEVIEKNSVAGEDGLIGADVFSRFLVDLDFPNGKLRLSELPSLSDEPAPAAALESRSTGNPQFHDRYIAPEMKSYWPIFRFSHELVISTRLNSSTPKLFLIDSGSFNNTISLEAAREVTKLSADSNARVKGLNGKVNDVFRANELILSFANFREINRDMIAFDTSRISDDTGTEISGILGFAMLRMLEIKIDYRDGLINFTYDSNRWR